MIRTQVSSFPLSIFSQYQSVSGLSTHFAISVVPHLFCCRPTSPPLPYPYLLSRISDTMLVRHFPHRWSCIPSPLSRSDDTSSGWQSFTVNICPVHCRPYNPFFHIRCPKSHLLPSHISFAAIYIHVVLHLLHRACPLMSSPLTLSAILPLVSLMRSLSHFFSSFCVLRLCCLFTFSGWIFSLFCIVLYYTNCSDLIHTTFLNLRSDILTTLLFYSLASLSSFFVMF